MQDLLYRIALTRVPQIGNVLAKTLVGHCGTAEAVFRAPARELVRIPGIGETAARLLGRAEALQQAEHELDWLQRHNVRVLYYQDDDYPHRLRSLPQGPFLLYYRGSADLNARRTVAIVGTRRPERTYTALTEQLISELLPYRPLIVSGLAYGIDVVAHRKALEVGLPTVGVLGHGLRHLYPAGHRSVAERMIDQGGLLSEYPSWVKPEREHFPMRNRIVAGMADVLVVAQTGREGGSMITARFGLELNREIAAFPALPGHERSSGGNWLIRTHRAGLIESAADLAEQLGWDPPGPQTEQQATLFTELKPEEEAVVRLLRQHRQLHVDQLQFESRIASANFAAVMLELECRGLVRILPGQHYILNK